jgi:hypothetical protein
MEQKIRRVISKFRHGPDDLAGRIDVTHIPFEEIRKVVEADVDDPLMYYGYELTSDQLAAFQSYIRSGLIPPNTITSSRQNPPSSTEDQGGDRISGDSG